MGSTSASSQRHATTAAPKSNKTSVYMTLVVAIIAIVAGSLCSDCVQSFFGRHDTPSSIATGAKSPLDVERLTLDYDTLQAYVNTHSNDVLRWGTYRSGLYYGVRSHTFPYSVSAGLLWTTLHEDISQMRYWSRQEDRLQTYGWLQHDGRTYAHQAIEDQHNRIALNTYYVRFQDEQGAVNGWGSRFTVAHLDPNDHRLKAVEKTKLSLFFFVDIGCGDDALDHTCRQTLRNLFDVTQEPTKCTSENEWNCVQASFTSDVVDTQTAASATIDAPLSFDLLVQLKTKTSAIQLSELRFSGFKHTNVMNIRDKLIRLAERVNQEGDSEVYLDNLLEDDATIVVVQAIIEAPVSTFTPDSVVVDVILNENQDFDATKLVAKASGMNHLMTRTITQRSNEFTHKFEDTFQLSTKHFNATQVHFAQAAFSNLMGGIGYFYGSSLIQHDGAEDQTIHESPPKPLFTAVPSRSFFPRGFLWDEGFHQLGLFPFDALISKHAMAHWFGLMDQDGYIAREQILGHMARQRVPSEFLIQHTEHANPPSLLLCMEKMLQHGKADQAFIKLVFPFLERWYHWFLTTQYGPEPFTFRWRGRRNDGKLIANTLSSGLDDYPRASVPSSREQHVDLLCWMIRASDILATMADQLGYGQKKYVLQTNKAQFLEALDQFHWNAAEQSYFDVGEHSADGRIEYQVAIRCRNDQHRILDTTASLDRVRRRDVDCPASHPTYMFPLGDGQGGLKLQPVFLAGTTRVQHVQHIGYVSLFPLLLKVLAPDSPKLKALLDQLVDPTHLWSPYGLRSLSTSDLFYERENAPGDNPYWRGSIWINLNYLALDALHHYAQDHMESPYQQAFATAYQQLRTNVMDTIYREYERTGYLWEQYNGNIHAKTQYGQGQRCHPFSGWTALVVNIMAERY